MKVQEILATKGSQVFSVRPEQSIEAALELLAEKGVGALVVINQSGRVVGIISERDIVREAVQSGVALFEEKVGVVMTRNLIIATLDDEVGYLLNTMTEKRIRHLPVMEGDNLLGLISIGDVVKAMRAQYEGEIHQLRHYVAEDTD